MLVDATHSEETRVAIVDDNRLEDFDFESSSKKQLKGNIYLAKVIRIEPSLQAAFVEYGGNRHGFLPFSEIHPDYFRIPMADRPHDEDDYDGEDDGDMPAMSEEAYAEEVRAYQVEAVEEAAESVIVAEPVEYGATTEDVQFTPTEQVEQNALSPVQEQAAEETPIESRPSAGLGEPADIDLGLITDFGNAAIDPVFTPAPAPLGTVGGSDMAEEPEERVRKPRMPRYKIQEVVKRRQIMLIQVVKEERGNKGAALTTFLSLAGRYCVLMPNTDRGGGVSRKITSHQDRRRMKEILDQLETPEGMAVILRTAGMEQEPSEIQRDLEHLLRLWNNIREQTLISTAPTLIYEEAHLIKRAIRDLYSADVSEVLVSGQKGFDLAHEFMRSLMPEDQDKIKLYEDTVPLFFRYNVERQIDSLYNPIVQLRSGGYIVINPTEALVSIDVNSGRATRERHIEGTALKTNLEAADEIARQLRLRDLAGLIVIDFIDMEDGRNNAAVERRMKEAMKNDRARLQIGRLSAFGLMEISRQRLHPSLTELNFERCPHCAGVGLIRTVDSAAISVLRRIEEDAIRQSSGDMIVHLPTNVALYVLNQKRSILQNIEKRYGVQVLMHSDDTLVAPDCRLERPKSSAHNEKAGRNPAVDSNQVLAVAAPPIEAIPQDTAENEQRQPRQDGERNSRRRGRFGRRDRNHRPDKNGHSQQSPTQQSGEEPNGNVTVKEDAVSDENLGNAIGVINQPNIEATDSFSQTDDGHRQGGRRRGRRGGRNRRGGRDDNRQQGLDRNRDGGQRQERAPRPERQGEYAQHAPYQPPISIHDLDTTPRDHRGYSHPSSVNSTHNAEQGQQHRGPSSAAPPPSPYEVTNPTTDKPKGGWWRKLTGQ